MVSNSTRQKQTLSLKVRLMVGGFFRGFVYYPGNVMVLKSADIIQAEMPPDRVVDGRSMMPFLRDATAKGHEVLCFEWNEQHAVRRGPWKVVRNGYFRQAELGRLNRATGKDYIFLSNLDQDPGEQNNVYAAHREIAQELLGLHAEWRGSIAADPTASPAPELISEPDPSAGR